jgi:hypothetical protein
VTPPEHRGFAVVTKAYSGRPSCTPEPFAPARIDERLDEQRPSACPGLPPPTTAGAFLSWLVWTRQRNSPRRRISEARHSASN